ncbi:molybdopterin-dependent oxidoreductase [Leifsonia sp. A12D58]|uniref:molybdopterin-dependent oxidoreductase n=1 Tax=Leifsonia sp. A12D58 TaxID=3397674 RepID=UPI0039DFF882
MAAGNSPRPLTNVWWQIATGCAAIVAGVGAAELTSSLIAQNGSPILVVGALVIDLVPGWVKEAVIAAFGTGDKAVLIISLAMVLLIGGAVAGILEYRRPPLGRLLIVLGGAVGIFAALTRSGASFMDAVPSIVAAVVGVFLLNLLLRRLHDREREAATSAQSPGSTPREALTRRRFLVATSASAGLGLVALFAGQVVGAGYRAASAARSIFTLPKATVPAPPIPASASFDVPGLSPLITPNGDFYRIDTALQLPGIDPANWTLKITGMVDNEVTLSFDELLKLPLEESRTTLTCVSNVVGGDLIGTATWLGYPIRHLLAQAKPHADADMVLSRSQDGWTASTPIEALTDDRNAILAIGMNGAPLPIEHGYPVRMVVPGLYGYVSATKWVVQLDVTRFDKVTSYWTDRGWSEHGPIKLSSRIDVPSGGSVAAGDVTVAGVAWSQHTGISAVQVQVDEGDWHDATLAEALNIDTWRQWKWVWPATSGQHTLRARATDADGLVQTAKLADVVPDGATGLDSISVSVN